MFNKISIIGAGLMGGSLALAVKEKFPLSRVHAYARSRKSLLRLKKTKIFDKVCTELKDLICDTDLVVLGAPVSANISLFKDISPYLGKKTVVIDLGSTKRDICLAAKKSLPFPANFTGCHPLCGSEKQGAENSLPGLYENTVCVCIGKGKTQAQRKTAKFWKELGAEIVWMSAAKHDRITSAISHLPHLLSFSLAGITSNSDLKYASTGFKDMSRLAYSPAELWADVFLSNRKNTVSSAERLIKKMEDFLSAIKNSDKQKIIKLIEQSKRKVDGTENK